MCGGSDSPERDSSQDEVMVEDEGRSKQTAEESAVKHNATKTTEDLFIEKNITRNSYSQINKSPLALSITIASLACLGTYENSSAVCFRNSEMIVLRLTG